MTSATQGAGTSCVDHAHNCASNMATLRHMAVSLLKRETSKKVGVANKRKLCGSSLDYLTQVIRGA